MIDNELQKIKNTLYVNTEELLPDKGLKTFLNGNSKFIRSKLSILYIKAAGCSISEDIINVIAAGELIHNASLLQDDIIDEADFRRGKSTIGHKFSPKISILCGDYLVSSSVKLLLKINNSKIINEFINCVEEMAKSEVSQFFQRGTDTDIEKYLKICKGKTARLFSTILKSCALLANIDPKHAEKFGELFGICFQIKNDTLPSSCKEDKKNGILTLFDIMGIENTSSLSDNYKRNLTELIKIFPQSEFRQGLEDLIKEL